MTTIKFKPGDPPRVGRLLVDGDELSIGVAVSRLLSDQRPQSPSVDLWRMALRLGLRLIARGQLTPTVTDQGFDAWRLGPLSGDDAAGLTELASALTVAAPSPDPERDAPQLREFLDAVADWLPRCPAAADTAATTAFAATAPQHVPHLRQWAADLGRDNSWHDGPETDPDAGVDLTLLLTMPEAEQPQIRVSVRVQSRAQPGCELDAAELWAGSPLGERGRVDTVLALRRAGRAWPALTRLLRAAVPHSLDLDDDEVADLLAGGAERLAALGVAVSWPAGLVPELTGDVVLGSPPMHGGFLATGEEVPVQWRLSLRGSRLSEAELDLLAEATRPVVRLREQWVLLDPALARQAREGRTPRPLTRMEALGAALTGSVVIGGRRIAVASAGWAESVREALAGVARERARQPAALSGTLRDYQLVGLRWLQRQTDLGLGGCLADDMGLGKTITLIALHLYRQDQPEHAGPTLVVCPATLLANWEREIARFAPGTPTRRYHGPARSLPDETGFVLTTYATMRLDAEPLAAAGWGMLVADEAQHVKNPNSDTARALRRIPAGTRVALTGTPVENSLSDLWAILDWTTPGLLGTQAGFRARWAVPIEADRDDVAAEQLTRLVAPFVLRRRKSDPGIAPELPAKTETDQAVELTTEQAGLYEAVVRETMELIRTSSGIARRGLVLKLLTALKQVCNHPAQYLKQPQAPLAGRSGKLDLLDELLDTILAEDGAVLVFTQYVAMARLLDRHLGERGVGAHLLHGGTAVPRRQELVDSFQNGDVPVLLLSLKAAGTGLNLTRADHVVHYDRWWNPAVEEQATDRAYRIGQTRPVQVHRFLTEGTVEDGIAALLESKRGLADAVLATGASALTELSDADLIDLVTLRTPG